MSGREWVCRGCICFNKCLWYPAKAGQSMARSWPSLSACALGEGSSGAGSAGGGAGAAAGFRCRRVRRRFAPRGASWGLPALQTSPGRELFLGRADADLQSGPPLGWLRYYCRARSEEKQGLALTILWLVSAEISASVLTRKSCLCSCSGPAGVTLCVITQPGPAPGSPAPTTADQPLSTLTSAIQGQGHLCES